LRFLPVRVYYCIGQTVGELLYLFDLRHRCLAYANIRRALVRVRPDLNLRKVTRKFYRNLGQNILEVLLIERIDKDYIKRYVEIEGLEHISKALVKGKGLILLGVHGGSWELSNVICANLGFSFNLFVRQQGFGRLGNFLNRIRQQKGAKIIQRENGLRNLLLAFRNNEAVGMTLDQGGQGGLRVNFLGGESSLATGAVKLALRHGIPVIPAYYQRIRGPYLKIIILPPFGFTRSGDFRNDLIFNLQGLKAVYEKFIYQYPEDYLWTYKIWKYGRVKHILILSDGKAGHIRQSEALARIVQQVYQQKMQDAEITVQQIDFKNGFSRLAFLFLSFFAGRYSCQGCLGCLRRFLSSQVSCELLKQTPDCIISCGSSLAAVNFILARENLAKSLVIMRPAFLGFRRFDLVIIPRHDYPLRKRNVLVIDGALSFTPADYLNQHGQALRQRLGVKNEDDQQFLGLLLGGDTKNFRLSPDTVRKVIWQLKMVSQQLGLGLLVTTSRRTSPTIEAIVKEELGSFSSTRLLVIANEKNIPEAVGGILSLSSAVVVSPESISMISEAVQAARYVVTFGCRGLSAKHRRFVRDFNQRGYIYFGEADKLGEQLAWVLKAKPKMVFPDNVGLIQNALKGLL